MTFEDVVNDWKSHDDWQFADKEACWKFMFENGQESLRQQLAEREKQVTLLRDAMQGAWKDGYCFVGPEGQTDEQKAFEQALTTTEPKP